MQYKIVQENSKFKLVSFDGKFKAYFDSEEAASTIMIGLPDYETAKTCKKKSIARLRYDAEVAGIVINGLNIRTDRESQAQIASAYVSLKEGFVTTVDFKGSNNWGAMTLADITPIASAVAQHVQTLFTKERQLCEQIDAADDADLDSINWS